MLPDLDNLLTPNTHPVLNNIDPDDNFINDVYNDLSHRNVSPHYNIEHYNRSFAGKPPSLDIFSINIRSFNRNNEMCTALLQSLHKLPDILVLTETWLDTDDRDTSDIEGYTAGNMIEGGGVCLLWVGVIY